MKHGAKLFVMVVLMIFSTIAIATEKQDIQTLFDDGWWDDALARLETLIESSPDDPEVNFLLGKIYFLNQDYDEAEKHLEHAIKLDDSVSEYHLWLGHTKGLKAQNGSFFKAPGRAKACKREYAKAVELDTSNIEARHALIQFHMKAPGFIGGDKKIAYEQADRIARLDSVRGYQAHSMLLESIENDLEKAESLLKQAIESVKGDTAMNLDPYFWYGYFLSRHERQAEAESLCFVGMDIDSTNIRIYISLAELYEQQQRYPEAIAQLDRAIAMDSTNLLPQYNKGKLLIISDTDLDLAERIFINYLNSKRKGWWPPYYGAHWRLAEVYDKQGQYDLAVAELEKGLNYDIKNDDINDEMKKLLKEIKKKAIR